jgi:hypothetical protein
VTASRVQNEPRAHDEEHREKIIVGDHDALLFPSSSAFTSLV